jgi:predicted MFS family arabinose efflux permease
MKTLSATVFAMFGAGLVAISYGLARFAFGLYVPPIRDELSLSPGEIGMVGAMPLVSFVLATLAAPLAADRLGARNAATLSAAFGVGGLSLISQASDAGALVIGVFACGLCTGLMMPALTAGMQALVSRSMHGRVSAVMNAGTSVGVMLAVPAVVLLASAWRLAYVSFAGLAAVGLFAAWLVLPSVSRLTPAEAASPPPITGLQWSRLLWLSLFAFIMGLLSAAYWVFAPDLVVSAGVLAPSMTGWLWFAVGVAGLGGALIADLADRNNPPITHALMLTLLAASLSLLAASPGHLVIAIFSALVFGLAYMSLTGLYLMTSIRLLPGRLSMGPVLPFIAVSIGQAVGSPLVGLLVGRVGYSDAFSILSAIGIVLALLSPLYPRDLADVSAEPAEDTGLQAAFDSQLGPGEESDPRV